MKLASIFAIAFLVLVQPAMAEPKQVPKQPQPTPGTQTVKNDRAVLAEVDIKDFADDVCWVAPEWRQISR